MRSGSRVKFSEGRLTRGDGSNGGEVGGEGAKPRGEVRGGVGQWGQRVVVVVAREVGPRNGHKPLRRRHRRRGRAAANGGSVGTGEREGGGGT